MIRQLVQKFPIELVKDKHVLIYVPLLQRLHQETVPSLKKQTAEAKTTYLLVAATTQILFAGFVDLVCKTTRKEY